MKVKIILTKENIDYFFDFFDKELYKRKILETDKVVYSVIDCKKDALLSLEWENAVNYLEFDTEEKQFEVYIKFIQEKDSIKFNELIIFKEIIING